MGFLRLVGKGIKNSVKSSIEYYGKMDKSYVCKKCGYEWVSKKEVGTPAICPRCSSKRIIKVLEKNNKMEEETCDYCGKRGVKISAQCQHNSMWSGICYNVTREPKKLCSKCTKKCKDCGKYFCPDHLKNHNC